MSAKWRRVQAWDREHLTGALTPLRIGLHALSTITLAVVLLVGVVIYSVLASVPVGLLALGLTWLLYIATVLLAVVVPAAGLTWLVRTVVKARAARFGLSVAAVICGGTLGAVAWSAFAWPVLHYDPVYERGIRFFPEFVAAYENTTLRRLPAFEMTELEFYSWWPMQLMLALFVVNMVVATVRRIEFKFVNLGVLTVHTGIVVIALGSLYYQAFKQEGDTILLAGSVVSTAGGTGPAQKTFFDREDPALWINAGLGWEQRSLEGDLPRYNDYSLDAGMERSARDSLSFGLPVSTDSDQGRDLRFEVPPVGGVSRTPDGETLPLVPEDVRLSVVGYATYAEPVTDWVPHEPPRDTPNPLRMVYLVGHGSFDEQNTAAPVEEPQRIFAFALMPEQPAFSITDFPELGVQHWIDADETRWARLNDPATAETGITIIARLPGVGVEVLLTERDLNRRTQIAETGWAITLEELLPEPPFPIITEGYEDSTSSVAKVRVEPPEGEPYVRWLYHRFPELNQDIFDVALADGRPNRRDADPSIEIDFLDQSKLQLYLNERSDTGLVDAVVRWTGGMRAYSGLSSGDRLEEPVERLSFDLGEHWPDAMQVGRPQSVPPIDREGDFIGTNDRAMIAVEVALPETGWSRVVWLPFARYMDVQSLRADMQRQVALPDGRWLALVFGRVQQRLPGFQLRLIDFEMLAYDHRGAPRDYQSLVRVEPTPESAAEIRAYDHVTKLNAPLKAPFLWSESRGVVENVAGELLSHLSPRQFKFSQAGWDRQGWEQSQELVDQGLADRPRASFTILGVGNNPGIHVIALGGVLMGVGIPWAFYVKPWLVRHKKLKIQRELAAKTPEAVAPAAATLSQASQPEPIGAAR